VDAQIRQQLPLQMRAMRESRGWTQSALAEKLGTTQNAVSRLENPKSAPPTIPTLKRIAQTFGVALIVKFASFSGFVESVAGMSRNSVAVPSYDSELKETASKLEEVFSKALMPNFVKENTPVVKYHGETHRGKAWGTKLPDQSVTFIESMVWTDTTGGGEILSNKLHGADHNLIADQATSERPN